MNDYLNGLWFGWFVTIFCLIGLLSLLECTQKNNTDSFIRDEAGLLSAEQRGRIARINQKLLEDLDIHFQVVILEESSPDLNAKAVQVFEQNRIGELTRGNKGLLFIVDPVGREARLAVGYDLEGMFTDAFSGYV